MKIATLTRAMPALFVVITLAACGQAAPASPTNTPPPAATAALPTAAPTDAPLGQALTFDGVEVIIPDAVASGATREVVPAAQEGGAPEAAIHPAYTEIKLSGYPAQGRTPEGIIQIYPVADYQQMMETAAKRVEAMEALLPERPAAPEKEIPVLPVYNEAQVIRAQVKYLDTAVGPGVRFVTMYAQGMTPVTNQNVFYTYQGLTSDGAYWISAIMPLNTGFFAPDAGSASHPPAGGIIFPEGVTGDEVKAYYQAVTDQLNGAPDDAFTPSLEALDTMMETLRVTAP